MNLFGRKQKSEKKGETILIVDDHENIITLYKYVLEKEGYNTVIARDGEEAMRIAEKNEPDLVLLDIMMPGITGLDVLHGMKRLNPSLPIILHSANSSFQDDIDSVIADAFIEKANSSPRQVIAKIQELLG